MKKLKQSEIKLYREQMLKDQGGLCAFCNQPAKKPCLDHAHHDPYKDRIRGVICNWCNIALGKLENARIRTGTSWDMFAKTFPGANIYIHGHRILGCYSKADWHPSKRKSEVIEFKRLNKDGQVQALIALGFKYETEPLPKNQAGRVTLFKGFMAHQNQFYV